jgi:alginate O-acetyltransferase complex protein AlgI
VLFNSLAFFVFFPTVVALYFATPARYRWALLLSASYYFYAAWKPEYLLLIILSTGVDYLVALKLGVEKSPGRRRALLIASLVVNLGVLVGFKYFNFFSASVQQAFQHFNVFYGAPTFDVLLPVGISFYTFQTISYTVDVYRHKRDPEQHLGRFAVYVAFFPQLVAGPIERSTRLLPQFRKTMSFDFERVVSGLGLMLWGLFKKVVIADRAAQFVDAVYAQPGEFQGPTVIVATYLFAFQIYCDFSGYSDMAVGSARVLGYELMENFDRPYWATSVTDFWRRWHISLSTWFRDYVYIPLGGGRVSPGRRVFNVAVVFLLSGLWHGANWTFIAWGAFHGLLLIATAAIAKLWKQHSGALDNFASLRWLGRGCGIVLTFHLVCFGWVMFRADSMPHVGELLSRLPEVYPTSVVDELTRIGPATADMLRVELGILALSVVALELVELARARKLTAVTPVVMRWSAWALLCVWLGLTAIQTHSPFIYFQF